MAASFLEVFSISEKIMSYNPNHDRSKIGDYMKSITFKLMASFVSLILIILLMISIGTLYMTEKSMTTLGNVTLHDKLHGDVFSMRQYAKSFYGEFILKDGTLIDKDGIPVSESDILVNQIASELEDEATIFMVDGDDYIRVSTSIRNDDGTLATGTYLGKDSAAYPSIKNGELFFGEATILGVPYLTAYDPIFDQDHNVIGILFVGVEKTNAQAIVSAQMSSFIQFLVIVTLIYIFIGAFVSWLISRSLVRPILASKTFAEELAKGKLTVSIDSRFLKDKTEVGSMVNAMEHMRSSIRELISDLIHFSGRTNEMALTMQVASETTSESGKEVFQAVNQIGIAATDQAENTENGSKLVEDLGLIIENNAMLSDELKNKSMNIKELSNIGMQEMVQLSEKTNAVKSSHEQIEQGIQKTNQSAEQIIEVTEIIKSISDQTNLLALNASIEAARAGDAGRGFSVVAEEIRKLAEESKKSTDYIDSIVHTLKENSKESIGISVGAYEIMNQQMDSVRITKDKFEEVFAAVNVLIESIGILDDSSQTIKEKREKVMDVMTQLAAIAEENAASSEEVVASVEQIGTSMDELADLSNDLAQTVNTLKEKAEQFEI